MDADAARKLTQRIYTRLNNRRPDIERAENYYEGDQPLNFATEEWKKANASRYADFSDNWCGTVVNAEAERLKPIGVTNMAKSAASKLWDALQMNEFDAQFSQGAVTALTAKRCFVIVWGDSDGEPIVTFEHPSSVEIEYDWENPRLRTAALKTWVDEDDEYATLYTADEVYKWKRSRTTPAVDLDSMSEQQRQEYAASGGWEPREGTKDEEWPIRNPLGVVPVVEIQNRPTLKGDPLSEIQGVMPMQDAINLLWAYLFLAADYASMDARVILGAEPPKMPVLDKDGNLLGTRPVEMKDLREKRLLTITGEHSRIDAWEAAKLDIFTDTIEIAVGHIAAQTRTPPHYLVANKGISNLSGDALKSAEIGLNKKAGEFITFTDPQLREVLRLVALVKGDTKTAQATRLAKIVWESPEIRSEAQLADALLKKSQMGYPFEYLLELDGRSPAEIRRIMKLRQKELDEALGAGAQMAVQGAIDDGSDETGE
ncbi:phage portal protein [Microbacterium sp. NPDC055455]